jgi:hypothetical protein
MNDMWHKRNSPAATVLVLLHACKPTDVRAFHATDLSQAHHNPLKPHSRPPLQLDLLPSELLGNVQFRSLQSLPHYGRLAAERHIETLTDRRATRWHHEVAFDACCHINYPPMAVQSNRNLEAWLAPPLDAVGDKQKQECMDEGSWRVAQQLFVKTWRPQQELGRSLALGEGV